MTESLENEPACRAIQGSGQSDANVADERKQGPPDTAESGHEENLLLPIRSSREFCGFVRGAVSARR